MTTGFSAPDFPFAKIPTEEIARKMLDQYPKFSNILRTTGEGSQDFNFFDPKDRAYIDGFLNLAKYLDVPVIVVLNGYNELMKNDRAEITRKSNMAIVDLVARSGVKVYAWAMANELYTKREYTLWNGTWTYQTKANLDNTKRAVARYMAWVSDYMGEIGFQYKYALNMATDLNKARIAWDTALYTWLAKGFHLLDAHIYPGRTVTGLALETLIKKRLGRGFGLGCEIICGEVNLDFGMYGTGTVPTYEVNGIKKPYPRSPQHVKDLNSIIGEVEKYAGVVCVHKLGSIQPNNYSMIQF